jgi:hyperosmotically inducible periplasmic protein
MANLIVCFYSFNNAAGYLLEGKMKTLERLLILVSLTLFAASSAAGQASVKASRTGQSTLERQVYHELVTIPFYSVFDNLAFKVEGNRVTLLGQVVSDTVKRDAERRVKDLEGAEEVINNIEVLPASQNDERIRSAVYAALYGDSSLSRYSVRAVPPIHIIVKGGHVTLEGAVATEMDKVLANTRANSVSGVFSVTNNLRVDTSDSR